MLCSGEEYLGIISSEKEWTEMMDERLLIPATNTTTTCSSSGSGSGMTNPITNKNSMAVRVSDKPTQTQAQALRCPRCDSSNTKFCYYNNYSLSQPRHFCKACKRYWTRGGMLRNIPVGGGCRKNKRARKPSAAAAPRTLPPPPPPDPIASSACLDPAAIYALQTAVSPLPILPTAFDMPPPPHLGGLAFDLQALPPSRLLDEYPHYVSNLSPSSLLLSGIKQPKQLEDYQTMLHIDELQASEINGSIKLETQSNNTMSINTIDWLTVPQEISLDNLGPAAALYWNAGIGGSSWPDGVNCGSSVPSLI